MKIIEKQERIRVITAYINVEGKIEKQKAITLYDVKKETYDYVYHQVHTLLKQLEKKNGG